MKEINSFMAGIVLSINITRGEQVTAGQEVIILESMKMAIPIESTVTGKVADIKVNKGDFVNEGDVLITLE